MPEVRLERTLRVPPDPTCAALGDVLRAIAHQEGPWRGFALHVSLGDLRLPDVGYVAVPIKLKVRKREREERAFDITFNAAGQSAAFPTFNGTMGVNPAGVGESILYLAGGYDLPMQLLGKFLDAAFTPGVANRSLENFIDEIGTACTARVDAREAEYSRYRFYARSLQ